MIVWRDPGTTAAREAREKKDFAEAAEVARNLSHYLSADRDRMQRLLSEAFGSRSRPLTAS